MDWIRLLLFADGEVSETLVKILTTLLGILGTVLTGVVGALVFYLRHLVTVVIPEMTKDHAATITSVTKDHAAIVASMLTRHDTVVERLVTTFRDEAKDAREMFRLDSQAEQAARDEAVEKLFREIRALDAAIRGEASSRDDIPVRLPKSNKGGG